VLQAQLRPQQRLLVVLDQLLRELLAEDGLGRDDEAAVGDLLLSAVDAVDLDEVVAGSGLLQLLVLPPVELAGVALVATLLGSGST
jgi:hypothetical protein